MTIYLDGEGHSYTLHVSTHLTQRILGRYGEACLILFHSGMVARLSLS